MSVREFQGEHRYLSNFWPAPVVLDGVTYPSVEHAYQAAKTLNPEQRTAFIAGTAASAKRRGRTVTKRPDWDSVKVTVMTDLVRQKFQNPKLAMLLRDTSGLIQEGNTWNDRFWGVDLRTGKGPNHLGEILMTIRGEMK